MIKCTVCNNHKQKGNKHTCSKCETKTIYGTIQEQFIESCAFFSMTDEEKKRRENNRKMRYLPIDDREVGIRKGM